MAVKIKHCEQCIMFPSLNKFINALTLSSLDNSSMLSLLDMVEPHTRMCIHAHTDRKKATHLKSNNLLSVLFYTFTFLYISTLLSILFYCWFLLPLPAPLSAALLRQPSPCLGSSGRWQRRRWAREGNWMEGGC